jgi:hypothetical protein
MIDNAWLSPPIFEASLIAVSGESNEVTNRNAFFEINRFAELLKLLRCRKMEKTISVNYNYRTVSEKIIRAAGEGPMSEVDH